MREAYSVIYSPEAINDLRKIYSYIAFELLVPSTAEGQVNRIRKTIRSLALCRHEIPSLIGNRGKAWECTKYLSITLLFSTP